MPALPLSEPLVEPLPELLAGPIREPLEESLEEEQIGEPYPIMDRKILSLGGARSDYVSGWEYMYNGEPPSKRSLNTIAKTNGKELLTMGHLMQQICRGR